MDCFLKSAGERNLSEWDNIYIYTTITLTANQNWDTDISYIHTAQVVLYLSAVRDLYDYSIVAYKAGTEQTVNLVLNTGKAAKEKETALQSCNSIATKSKLLPCESL